VVIECSSRLAGVVVHARGALVTREVALPELDAGVVDIAVPGVTIFAEPGSVRAALEGSERTIAAASSALVLPKGEVVPGPTLAKVRDLTSRIERLDDERGVLTERRKRIEEAEVSPAIRGRDGRRPRDVLDTRFQDALTMAALVREKCAELDRRTFELEVERRELERALEAARMEDRQTSTRERLDHPTRTLHVRLLGEGKPGRLLVTYAVRAARWWPSYTLRVDGRAEIATWTFEAIVAQQTGEDWNDVALALSSADLVFDARLPELASLRFGRAQRVARRPYREPPRGVDALFEPYLAFGASAFTTTLASGPPPMPEDLALARGMDIEDEEETAVVDEVQRATKRPPPPMAAPAPARARMMPGAGAPPPLARAPMPLMAVLNTSFGGAAAEVAQPPPEPEVVPSEAWGDYERLVLANADEPRRGRLVPQPEGNASAARARAERQVDRAADARYLDPLVSRGMFDHRYDAEGRADIPSDGRVHRVSVGTASSKVKTEWRTVPFEAPLVYREARVTNPFEVGLLGGPVDVYLDGSLLTTTAITRIDRGGNLSIGMGVDDRIKVARNVRIAEESAGLLGGSLSVTHAIEIELASTIKPSVEVTVLERLPVTDDKALEIKLVRASPEPEPYDQADRDAPVRGGQRFDVTVVPEKKSRVELSYRLVFAQKLDIVGGSRRE
jgi:hypothetical protein